MEQGLAEGGLGHGRGLGLDLGPEPGLVAAHEGLQPGGQVLHNVMIVRKFGLPVARLDEVITRTEK